MRKNEETIKKRYFEWMESIVIDDRYSKVPYKKLINYLHQMRFVYIFPMDSNRWSDGVNLRYRFGYIFDIEDAVISEYLDNKDCSILEMLIALSIRIEESIMSDSTYGNRVGQWFWNMILNLGLLSMTDDNFDPNYIDFVISRFENHEYNKDGSNGGLFIIHDRSKDMRSAEIWYQMCWALNEII